MSRPTIVVVGAGPAGSTTARLLAERGARVTLIEARRLPRPKLCGGGLTPKARRWLPATALATIERRVDRVELRGGRLMPLRLREADATIAMVERDRFDVALVEAAAAAGVEVRDADPVRTAIEDEAGVRVDTAHGRIRADVLIAADGEPSQIARELGVESPPARRALALEVDLPFPSQPPPDTAVVSFSVPAGYAWSFPKADHANIGVATADPRRYRLLRADLARFARTLGLAVDARRVRGHWIAVGLRTGALATRRTVLVGDAAGAADPLFGEGISYAMRSGALAAATVEDRMAGRMTDLRAYDKRLRRDLGPAFRRLAAIARAVECSVTLVLLTLWISGSVRRVAVDVVAGRRPPYAFREPAPEHISAGTQADLDRVPAKHAAMLS